MTRLSIGSSDDSSPVESIGCFVFLSIVAICITVASIVGHLHEPASTGRYCFVETRHGEVFVHREVRCP